MNTLLIPIGSAGDVFPFIGLGAALRRRGHRVTVLTNPYFESAVRQTHLEFSPLGTADEFLDTIKNPDIWHPRKGFQTVAAMIARHKFLYDLIQPLMTPGTVIIAHSLALAARVGQDRCNWPVVTVHPTPMLFRSLHEVPTMMNGINFNLAPRWLKRCLWWYADRFMLDRHIAPPLNQFRATLNLPPVHRIFQTWLHSPLLSLGLFPDWFAAPQPDWLPHWHAVGFPLFDTPGSETVPPDLDHFLTAGPPPIVFTPGSAMVHGHRFFQAALHATQHLNRRALFLTKFTDQLPRDLPPTIRHVPFAPLSVILPRCAAIVHHGGIGTMSAALNAGIPQLIMPMSHDQPDNAARIRRLGVGSHLPPRRFRADALAQQLDTLLNSPDIHTRCTELSKRCKQSNTLDRMCDLIEKTF